MHALADVNCYCKMTSLMELDSVTLFNTLGNVTNTCKCMQHSPTIGRIFSVAESWKKLKNSNVFSSFVCEQGLFQQFWGKLRPLAKIGKKRST